MPEKRGEKIEILLRNFGVDRTMIYISFFLIFLFHSSSYFFSLFHPGGNEKPGRLKSEIWKYGTKRKWSRCVRFEHQADVRIPAQLQFTPRHDDENFVVGLALQQAHRSSPTVGGCGWDAACHHCKEKKKRMERKACCMHPLLAQQS